MLELKIFFDEFDVFENKPLYEYIMRYLLHAGVRGATLIEGRMGFGAKHKIQDPHHLGNTDETPIIIICVDEEEKIKKVLPHIREIVSEGLILTSKVEVIK